MISKKLTKKTFISLILFLSFSFNSEAKPNRYNKKIRIVALTSLTADLINTISKDSLIGVPGSSILKKNKEFDSIPIVSSGRMPPDLEKIISLKPDLVIGAKGFHDRPLLKLNSLGINTLSTSVTSLNDLDILYKQIASKLKTQTKSIEDVLQNCYSNKKNKNKNKNKNLVVLVSSKPILSPNKNSWAGNLISSFKLNNLASEISNKSEFKGYVNLSPEWLLKSQPENILVIKTPGSNLSEYNSMNIWKKLDAVKNDKVFTFEYYGLINAGGIKAINKACQKLASI
ncbi:Molybdenum transport ATP-binding protein ModC [Prochlorococcus marinus str. MIT 9201]|uniref:Molybdenum transport ATP-binding protein ModC n=1 Tax=Prochlorococcus marinus str. MIT 9201 TaxID=93057 RepID=A0A0A2A765_PROMR|nr:ABC transporter substrate-binding protein [Prochlorococcus marinus]KGF96344.1 Molybdenum transport ATP-binding protein ModC [Prochlorococcus marinus str. MIT 9201]